MIVVGKHKYCSEHIPIFHDIKDEKEKPKVTPRKLKEMADKKRKEQREKDLKDGVRFICSCCKRAVKVTSMSRKKGICRSCAGNYTFMNSTKDIKKENEAKKELLKKKQKMSIEEKANQANKEQDMIAAFLAKKKANTDSK